VVPLFTSPWVVGALALLGGAAALIGSRICGWQQRVEARLLPLALPIIYALGLVSGPLAGLVLVAGSVLLVLLIVFSDRAPWIVPVVLVVVTIAAYLRTLLPSLGEADTFEFQVIVPRLGVAHPTGYPLYVLLTKVFTLLPLRTMAWRVSLASAVYATGAVLALYCLVLRLTGRKLPSLLAALTFGFSSVFWSQAVVAEVYTLHALFVVMIAWLLLAGPSTSESRHPHRRWLLLALLFGVSLTNHLTTALLVPAALAAMIWDRPRLRPRQWLLAGGLLLAGLSVYLFIPLRWPALNDGSAMSLAQFVEHVSGGQFRGALQLDGWRDAVRWSIVGRLIGEPLGSASLALAAVGVAVLAFRQRRTLALSGVVLIAFLGYGLSYHVPDIAVFLIPAHLILSIWAAIGIAAIEELGKKSAGGWLSLALVAAVAVVPMSLVWQNLPQVDLSQTPQTEEQGRRILNQPLAANSAILADPTRFAPLYYVQQIEGQRPDIDIVLLGTEALYWEELVARMGRGQTVYLARFLPHLEQFWLRSAGPLVEVSAGPFQEAMRPDTPLRIGYQSAIELVGINVDPAEDAGFGVVRLALHWAAIEDRPQDYFVRFRLVNGSRAVAWRSEAVRPVAGMYPTSAWRPGEVVVDYHELVFPVHLIAGSYFLEVGLFPQFSDEGLLVDGGDGPWAAVLEVPLLEATAPGNVPPCALLLFPASRWLTGHDAPREAVAGAPIDLTLSWRVGETGVTRADGTPVLVWRDAQGRLHGQVMGLPSDLSNGTPTFITRHLIEGPATAGEHWLMVGWLDSNGDLAPVTCGWLTGAKALCELRDVDVFPASDGVANFGDRFLLLEAEAGVDEANSGGLVAVDLRWRALRAVARDYTVFVQLVGPDGRLHGQVDAWPVQGTLPTSQWRPGIDTLDHHTVRLDPDAPAGRYTVHVGWYLLENMQRLQLVDELGQPYGDSYVVAEFDVATRGD